MRWFGESWGAPACQPENREPTPVGNKCIRCDQWFKHGDQGFLIPMYYPEEENLYAAWHRDCLLASLGIGEFQSLSESP